MYVTELHWRRRRQTHRIRGLESHSFIHLQGRNIHTDSTMCNKVLGKLSGHKTEEITGGRERLGNQ